MEFQRPRALLGSFSVDADDETTDVDDEDAWTGVLMYSKEVRGVVAEEPDIFDIRELGRVSFDSDGSRGGIVVYV